MLVTICEYHYFLDDCSAVTAILARRCTASPRSTSVYRIYALQKLDDQSNNRGQISFGDC